MFKWFCNSEIEISLSGLRRQYFVGDLDNNQELKELKTEKLEIGLTSYETFMSELPHRHSKATEYQYMISGWTRYLDIETKEEHDFKTGDFFAIYPGTTYAQKSKPGTKILFIKVPSIRDKELVETSSEVQLWFEERLNTIRNDYFHEVNAPAPNSIRPAAAVVIENANSVLMIERADSGNWSLPGGTLDYGESLPTCAIREMHEETGLDVELKEIIGVYTDPDIRIAYSDGEVRQEFTVVYYGAADSDTVSIDEESTAYRWVPIDNLLSLKLADSQRQRLTDVVNYLKSGTKVID